MSSSFLSWVLSMNFFTLVSPYLKIKDFRVQYFDDLHYIKDNLTSAIWLFTFYSQFWGSRGEVLYFVALFFDWIAKSKWNLFMYYLTDEYPKRSSMAFMNTTKNKSMYKNRKFYPKQYLTRYWFSRLKVNWKIP